MTDTEVALVLPEAGELALLEQDGQAARDYARESLSPATRRACRSDHLRTQRDSGGIGADNTTDRRKSRKPG